MAFTKCWKCGRKIRAKAKICRHCGVKYPAAEKSNILIASVFSVFLFAFLYWAFNNDSSRESAGQAAEKRGKRVSHDQFGDEWPFTVSAGIVDCTGGQAAVFRVGSKTYQLNGFAKTLGYEPIDSIWKENPNNPGTRISIGPMISLALQECQ